MNNQELHRRYLESSFSLGNILSKDEFETAAIGYDLNYKDYLPSVMDAKILDVGCGAGHFLYFLNKKGYNNHYGIDISEQQIDFCKRNISEQVELADVFEFLKGKKDICDLIVANDVLEHIPKRQTMEFLGLIYCSLKDNGTFILRVPNMSNPFSLDSRYKDFTHETGFTHKSLYQVLYIANFKSIKIYPEKVIFPKTLKGLMARFLVKIFYAIIRKIFAIQGFVVPDIVESKNLIGVAKKY